MRTLKRNTQKLYYANLIESDVVYKLDEYGNKIVSFIDDSVTPPVTYYEELGVTEEHYEEPQEIRINIAQSNGDVYEREFGLSESAYEAKLVTDKGKYPIKESALIWHKSEPVTLPSGYADPTTADYRVISINTSLNTDKFVLDKIVQNANGKSN